MVMVLDYEEVHSMSSKKLATTVYITEQQQAILKELNMRSKVPVAEFIRQGIDLVIHRYRELLPGQPPEKELVAHFAPRE
jgi:hypothetical protein